MELWKNLSSQTSSCVEMVFLEISSFFGRLHPLIVHIPIGFLILALIFDLPGIRNRMSNTSIVWFFSFISTIITVIFGLLLSKSGHYIEAQLWLHQWSGILLLVLCGLGWIMRSTYFNFPDFKKLNNVMVILTLLFVGHNGGSLTHGENYLFEHAPEWLKVNLINDEPKQDFTLTSLDSIYVYNDFIQPLFERKCISCHNNQIQRGGLDMTTPVGLFKGGLSGKAIVQKDLDKSLVYNRIIKEQSDKRFMPPAGIPLTYSEIKLIECWILEGAEIDSALSEQSLSEGIQSLLLKQYNVDTREKPWFEKVSLKPLSQDDYLILEKHQLSWRKLADENSLLDVRFQGNSLNDNTIAVLKKYAQYITWLNLSEVDLQNKTLETISNMQNLTRLYLQKSDLSNVKLSLLSPLKHLEILNLHSTQVDQQVFDVAMQLPSLKKVYLWNTAVSTDQIKSQQSFFPNTAFIGGLE